MCELQKKLKRRVMWVERLIKWLTENVNVSVESMNLLVSVHDE